MWNDATALLRGGASLSTILNGQLTRLSACGVGFVLVVYARTGATAPVEHYFAHPHLALLAYLEVVGPTHLARAVGVARYAHLFPLDSSLSWTPVPLHAWRPLPPFSAPEPAPSAP